MQENLTEPKAKERNKRAWFRAILFIIGFSLLLYGAGDGFATANTQNKPENIAVAIGICIMIAALFRQYQSKQKEEMNRTTLNIVARACLHLSLSVFQKSYAGASDDACSVGLEKLSYSIDAINQFLFKFTFYSLLRFRHPKRQKQNE